MVQGTLPRSGDVLLVRTASVACWNDEVLYLDAAGVDRSGSEWAAEHQVAAVGIDNMTWDAPHQRDAETGATLFGHVYLIAARIYIIENFNLE